MKDREAKKQTLLELVKRDPEAVVDMLLDLMERVEALEDKLAVNSRNSSKPPSSDQDSNKPKPKSLRKKGRRKSGGQKGHPGKSLEFSKHHDFKIEHKLDFCPLTGEALSDKDIVNIIKRQVFDIPEPRLDIHEHWIYSYQNSSGQIVTAESPEGINAPVQYGKRFYSWLVYQNDYQLIPLKRIRQMCSDLYGYSVSEGTILKARRHCYNNLEVFEDKIKDALKSASIAHADETGFKVGTQPHWMHVVCNARYTFLGIHRRRGYQAIEDFGILKDFSGRLVHDCLEMYFRLNKCQHSLCNPHLIRELIFSKEQLNQQWASKMKDLLEEAYLFREKTKQSDLEKSRRSWTTRYGKIIVAGYNENPDDDQPPDRKGKRGRKKKTKSRNLLERMDRHRDKILAFIFDSEIPFSNNQAEQDIRMLKVKQKISGGFRTFQNAEIFARIRSFISTAQKNDTNAWTALNKAFLGDSCSVLPF